MRNGIDLRLGRFLRTKGSAVVEIPAPIPSAVPRVILNGRDKSRNTTTISKRFFLISPLDEFGEISQDANFEPGQPDTLAFAADADPIEAIVPISRSNQREAMRTRGGRMGNGPSAMFEQRSLGG